MLTINMLTHWQAFIWLWRNDPEARWFWFKCWLFNENLNAAVQDNYRDFGSTICNILREKKLIQQREILYAKRNLNT